MIISRVQALAARLCMAVNRGLQQAVLGAFALAIIASMNLNGQEESLVLNPPFKTVDRGASRDTSVPVATQGSLNERFEFSGYFDDGSEVKFSIRDQRNSKPYWVGIGERIEGIQVESWDPQKQGVILTENGKREMLVLKEMKRSGGNRVIAPMFNPVAPKAPTTYPSPPPSLPKPTQLMEKLRREQARLDQQDAQEKQAQSNNPPKPQTR